MKTTLTLRLDEQTIARVEDYAATQGVSVAGLVEDFLRGVSPEATAEAPGGDGAPATSDWRDGLGPRVRTLVDRPPPRRRVDEGDYMQHLRQKHS